MFYKNIDRNVIEYVLVWVRFNELFKKCSDNLGINDFLNYEIMMKNL